VLVKIIASAERTIRLVVAERPLMLSLHHSKVWLALTIENVIANRSSSPMLPIRLHAGAVKKDCTSSWI
jgi:hypothetical protein